MKIGGSHFRMRVTAGKITAIRRQKTRSDRVSIYLDDRFSFGLLEEVFLQSGWKRGDSITENDVHQLLARAAPILLRDKAYRMLSLRAHSERDLSQKLRRQGFDSPDINALLHDLREKGLLNDAEFARHYVEQQKSRGIVSRRGVSLKLRQRGIEPCIIQRTLDDIWDENIDLSSALILISKKWKSRKKKFTERENRDRIFHSLYQKGWSLDTLRKAWDQFHKKNGAENENG